MCNVKLFVIENSALCEYAIEKIREAVGDEAFSEYVEIIYITQRDLQKEEYDFIKGIPTFVLEKGGERQYLMGADPSAIKTVANFLENCMKKI